MGDDLQRVATRLRVWREDAGLSLQSLATRSGVAASTIQKIERQQMVPTIGVLLKIAHGLRRRPSEFLDEQGTQLEVVHLPATKRRRHPDGSGGRVERLAADLIDPRFDAYRVEHAPGGSMGRIPIHFHGEQLILGLAGELTVTIDARRYLVQPGDTLHWKAHLPHFWANEGTEPARFLIAGTLPEDMRGVMRMQAPAALAASGASGESVAATAAPTGAGD